MNSGILVVMVSTSLIPLVKPIWSSKVQETFCQIKQKRWFKFDIEFKIWIQILAFYDKDFFLLDISLTVNGCSDL